MGLFTRAIASASLKQQQKELRSYVTRLSNMDSDEIGGVLAIATHWRHTLGGEGIDVMHPAATVLSDPAIGIRINRIIKSLQKARRFPDAAGMMIWIHTIRTAYQPDLRPLARAMWGELRRGMEHVEEGANQYLLMTQTMLDTDNFDEFPEGLTPEPK